MDREQRPKLKQTLEIIGIAVFLIVVTIIGVLVIAWLTP